jgi:hypothetical protein
MKIAVPLTDFLNKKYNSRETAGKQSSGMNKCVNIKSHYYPAQNNEEKTLQGIENFIVHNLILYENGNYGYISTIDEAKKIPDLFKY